jgi:tetratricopeptide (TPR) repeat protein
VEDRKLSEILEYREFGLALAEGRLVDARNALELCLALPELQRQPRLKAFLQQTLGELLFDMGDESGGLASHTAGAETDHTSPLASLRLAAFLAVRLGRFRDALRHCEEARTRGAVPRGDSGAISPAKLEVLVLALEARCHAALAELPQARYAIHQLIEMDRFPAEHAVEACETLICDPGSQPVARQYLENLLRSMNEGGENLVGLRRHVASILARH